MLAYKGFGPGQNCRGYSFLLGLNVTDKANCRENGFHCAENPLDCLSYYPDMEKSEYFIVNVAQQTKVPISRTKTSNYNLSF